MASLSEKERRFVEAYMGPAAGNGTEACRAAGYQGNAKVLGVQATRLLAKASVQSAITDLRAKLESAGIADAKERRVILSLILRSGEADARDRIRAIDVANKMDGVYIEKHEHSGTVTLAQLLEGPPA